MKFFKNDFVEAQKLASSSRQQQLGTQKGTGEAPTQVGSRELENSLAAQKVTSQTKGAVPTKKDFSPNNDYHPEEQFEGEGVAESGGVGGEEEEGYAE